MNANMCNCNISITFWDSVSDNHETLIQWHDPIDMMLMFDDMPPPLARPSYDMFIQGDQKMLLGLHPISSDPGIKFPAGKGCLSNALCEALSNSVHGFQAGW